MHAPGLDRAAQRGARRQQALLADHLVQRARPHALGERTQGLVLGCQQVGCRIGRDAGVTSAGFYPRRRRLNCRSRPRPWPAHRRTCPWRRTDCASSRKTRCAVRWPSASTYSRRVSWPPAKPRRAVLKPASRRTRRHLEPRDAIAGAGVLDREIALQPRRLDQDRQRAVGFLRALRAAGGLARGRGRTPRRSCRRPRSAAA